MIKKANKLFTDKQYKEALELYEKLVKKDIIYSGVLEYNIKVCKKYVPKQKLKSTNNSIEELLKSSLEENVLDKGLPDFEDIQIFFHSLQDDHLNDLEIMSILKVAKSSPFQIKLLEYTRKLLVKNKYKNLLYSIPLGLNIATMIKLATDKVYWLENRIILRKKYTELYKKEYLFYKLIEFSQYSKLFKKWNTYKKEDKRKLLNTIHKEKSIAIGTILLNEQKFIGLSLYQHYNLCDKWVLVEGTCLGYPTRKVTEKGFSKDLTQQIIEIFPDPESKIRYIKYGWTKCGGEDAKSELRNEYLKYIQEDFLLVLDADEFYFKEDLISALKEFDNPNTYGITLPQVHFWKDTTQYITGEYYDISHTRIYRNIIGMKYVKNHNFPELNKKFIHEKGHIKYQRTQLKQNDGFCYKEPCCFHMGFAKDYDDMKDKSDYYVNRGEKETRKSTTASRAGWFDDELPEKCRVKKWSGKIPKVLKGIE
jgi:hypothetical protein